MRLPTERAEVILPRLEEVAAHVGPPVPSRTPSAANEIRVRIQNSGSGKTMLAKCLPGLLPPPDFSEALETIQVHTVAGTLAHNGVLFLDESPESPRNMIELLRRPLEDGAVTLDRSQLTLIFPARFMPVVAMNPCPCRHQLTQPYSRRDGWNSESAK